MKKQKPNTDNIQKLVINIELWNLIVKDKITSTLMTHQDKITTGPLRVYTPGHPDKAKHFNVQQIFPCGNGYLAEGYPESWRVRGSNSGCKALRVVAQENRKLETGNRKPETAPTNAEGEE
jgi:hypothetical protein